MRRWPARRQLAVALRDAITRVNRRLRQTRPIGDLTIAQISALQSLDAAGALTPRELAEAERVQPPTMTRIVARLEERGLVQRTPHPTDGRQVILARRRVGPGAASPSTGGPATNGWPSGSPDSPPTSARRCSGRPRS